jgi:deoxyhypusine synthase
MLVDMVFEHYWWKRNGADYAVYINTGQEVSASRVNVDLGSYQYDGSDSGARPDEAISWGKIRAGAKSVKVYADATLVFPLIVAGTFGKAHWAKQAEQASKASQ